MSLTKEDKRYLNQIKDVINTAWPFSAIPRLYEITNQLYQEIDNLRGYSKQSITSYKRVWNDLIRKIRYMEHIQTLYNNFNNISYDQQQEVINAIPYNIDEQPPQVYVMGIVAKLLITYEGSYDSYKYAYIDHRFTYQRELNGFDLYNPEIYDMVIRTIIRNPEILRIAGESNTIIKSIKIQKTKNGMYEADIYPVENNRRNYRTIPLFGTVYNYEGLPLQNNNNNCAGDLINYSCPNLRKDTSKDGMTLDQLEQFAIEKNIPMLIVDLFDEPIINYKFDTKRGGKKRTHIIAKVINGHLYNITDDNYRRRLTGRAKSQMKQDTRTIEQLPSLDLSKLNKNTIYTTEEDLRDLYLRCLNDNYIPIIRENQFHISTIIINGITIHHDRHRAHAKSLLDKFNEAFTTEHIYYNQSITTILRMFIDYIPLSTTSDITGPIFEDNIASGGFFEITGNKQLGLDINKAYPTIMANEYLPYLTGQERPEAFTEVNDRDLYYIIPQQRHYMCEEGYFYGCAVRTFLELNFITIHDIKDQIRIPSYTGRLKEIMGLLGTQDKIVNMYLSGLLAEKNNMTKVARTASLDDVNYLCQTPGTTYKLDIMVNGKPIYKVERENKESKINNHKPSYVYIIHKNYSNVLKLVKYINTIPTAVVTGIKTDCVYYTLETKDSEIGNVPIFLPQDKQVTEFKDILGCYTDGNFTTKHQLQQDIFKEIKHKERNYKRITEKEPQTIQVDNSKPYDYTQHKSFHIDSLPGTGKSYILKTLQTKDTVTLTFTNAVASQINGQTLHRYFNQKVGEIDYDAFKPKKIPKILLIDECYNIPSEFYPFIAHLKLKGSQIYSFGDSRQLESIDRKYMSLADKKRFWARMSDINIILMHNWRSSSDYVEQCEKQTFTPTKAIQPSIINICRYNSTKEAINTVLFQRFGYMRFVVTRNHTSDGLFKGQIYELKDDRITLLYRGQQPSKPFKPFMYKYIEPGYCITNHIAQGSSISESYTIFDYDNMDQRARFVALTRTTDPTKITVYDTLPREERQKKLTWSHEQKQYI